jgi:hypothetical protein
MHAAIEQYHVVYRSDLSNLELIHLIGKDLQSFSVFMYLLCEFSLFIPFSKAPLVSSHCHFNVLHIKPLKVGSSGSTNVKYMHTASGKIIINNEDFSVFIK